MLGFHGTSRADEIERGLELDYSPPTDNKTDVVDVEKDGSTESINHLNSARSTKNLISSSDDQAETSFITHDEKSSPVPTTTTTKEKRRQPSTESIRQRVVIANRNPTDSVELRRRKTSNSYEIRLRRLSQRKPSASVPLLIPDDNFDDDIDDDEATFTEITQFKPIVKRRSGTMEPPNLEMLEKVNNDRNESAGTDNYDDARLIKDGGTSPRRGVSTGKRDDRFRNFGNDDDKINAEEKGFYDNHINRDSLDSVIPTERIIRNIEEKDKASKTISKRTSTLSYYSIKSHIELKDLKINLNEADDTMNETEAAELVKRFSSAVKTIYSNKMNETLTGGVSPMPPTSGSLLPPLLKGALGGATRKKSKSKKRKNSSKK